MGYVDAVLHNPREFRSTGRPACAPLCPVIDVETAAPARRTIRSRAGATPLIVVGLAVLLGRQWIAQWFDQPALLSWMTVFVALVVQAVPFLVLGVLLAGTIATFLPSSVLRRLLPDNPVVGVPAATAMGAVLPGCECASVPVAGSLVRRGIAPAAAFAFLLAAPPINPMLIVSTAVAFQGRPEFVAARFSRRWRPRW